MGNRLCSGKTAGNPRPAAVGKGLPQLARGKLPHFHRVSRFRERTGDGRFQRSSGLLNFGDKFGECILFLLPHWFQCPGLVVPLNFVFCLERRETEGSSDIAIRES
jgi:hypothetical protein